jgi:hypothetical protein
VNIKYGSFINAIVNFLIIAFVLFVVIKAANKTTELRKKLEHQEDSARGAHHEDLPLLPHGDPHRRHPLPPLHLRAEGLKCKESAAA